MKTDCIDHGRKGNPKGYWLTTRKVGDKLVQSHAHRIIYCLTHGLCWEDIWFTSQENPDESTCP